MERALAVLGLILTATMITTTAPAASAAGCAATPFRSSAGKRIFYRIPAVVATPHGTLIAFAERRHSTGPASDRSDTEIVMARSASHGCHWSAPRVIADHGRHTVGNPVPVVDAATGTVLLLSMDRAPGGTTRHGLHLQRSTDDGRTFSAYRRSRLDLAGMPGWSGGLTGPGHAIQLRSPRSPHPGRIVVPMGFKQGSRYGGYAILSDDHGAHWKVGYKALGTDGRIEGTAAELPDGRLFLSYRNRDSHVRVGTGRIAAWSSDGGSSLDAPFRRMGLPTVSVKGSALGLQGRYAGTLLFSSPSGQDRNRRTGMAVYTSTTAGKRWSKPHRVQPVGRPAAYSDLVQLDDRRVGLLFETGRSSWQERIEFRTVAISTLVG